MAPAGHCFTAGTPAAHRTLPSSFCMTCIKAIQFRRLFTRSLVCVLLLLSFQLALSFNSKESNGKNLNSCEKCKIVVQSFIEGLKRTSRGKHEGGDAYWEKKRLYNYAHSEIRLTEIQETLCQDVSSGKDQCHSFAEEFESELEEWFLQELKKEKQSQQQQEGNTLFEHLCNGAARACCPEGHFGPNCEPCLGYPGEVCYGRGYCGGNGTREGSGKCSCFKGFSGQNCEKCAKNYIATGTVDKLVAQQVIQLPESCTQCDRSCASTCRSSGPKGCHVCRKGFMWDNESGCVDTNECAQLETNACKENTYCVNTEGSFNCLQCHKACQGCVAAGDHSCLECADHFELTNGKCVVRSQVWIYSWSRYLTYLCLAVTTWVIARSSVPIGWTVGLLTTLYIAICEFELTHDSFFSSVLSKFR